MSHLRKSTLNEWLDYISGTHPENIEMGLDRIRCVFELMNIDLNSAPLRQQQVVVVSGTNGKGSTIALIEAGLLSMGLEVGTYTSPHIHSYNERVKINSKPVSDEKLVTAFSHVEEARADIPLTYFEFGTLAAFDILFTADLDVLILEIGLGGRLDAVNIVDSDLAIITSVALDHTDWLGASIEGIGFEKAGVLRANTPALFGENLPESVYLYAEEISCPALSIDQDFARTDQGVLLLEREGKINYQGFPDLRLPENNILLALQAIKHISQSLKVTKSKFCYPSLIKCFSDIVIAGRLEEIDTDKLSSNQQVFLDVGHNPHAAQYLLGFLKSLKCTGKKVNAVYSSLSDKDVIGVSKILSPVFDTWFIAPLEEDRALDIQALETAVGKHAKNMLSFETLDEALGAALIGRQKSDQAEMPSVTLVFGSFYVIEAAKAYFKNL